MHQLQKNMDLAAKKHIRLFGGLGEMRISPDMDETELFKQFSCIF